MCMGFAVPFSPPKNSNRSARPEWNCPAAAPRSASSVKHSTAFAAFPAPAGGHLLHQRPNPSASKAPVGVPVDLAPAHPASTRRTAAMGASDSSCTLAAATPRMQQRPCLAAGWRVIQVSMPVFKIVRFAVRPDARAEVEKAMREFALYVGLSRRIPPGPRTAIAGTPTSTSRSSPPTTMTLPSTSAPPAGRSSSPACCTPALTDVEAREYELVATSRGGLPPERNRYWRCAMIARSAAVSGSLHDASDAGTSTLIVSLRGPQVLPPV